MCNLSRDINKMEYYWFWITPRLVNQVEIEIFVTGRVFSVEKIETSRNLERGCGVIISLISPLIKWRRSIT